MSTHDEKVRLKITLTEEEKTKLVRLLPTASRIGFTGTPLLSSDRITERTFGGYISVYDFQRAMDDGATVPLYYENRGEKILDVKDNPEITDRILDAIE